MNWTGGSCNQAGRARICTADAFLVGLEVSMNCSWKFSRNAWIALLLGVTACGGGSTDDPAAADAGGTGGSDGGVLDAPGDSPFTGTMQCGDLPVANPTCAACADDNCCAKGEACAQSPDCVALRECRRGCAANDEVCQEGCEAQHPEGAPFDSALTACRMHECATDCFAGAAVDCGFSLSPAGCQACATAACCDVGYAANLEPAFWDYDACVRACSDNPCFQTCADEHPEGYLHYLTWVGCLGSGCASECGISPAMHCGAYYSDGCAPCVEQSCCGESAACYQDVDCVAIDLCARSCAPGDTACLQGCASVGPASTKWSALNTCLTGSCATTCP